MSLQKPTIAFIKETLKDNKIRKIILQDALEKEGEYRKKQKEYNKKYYHTFRKKENTPEQSEVDESKTIVDPEEKMPLMSEPCFE